jgi:hypothetical protein
VFGRFHLSHRTHCRLAPLDRRDAAEDRRGQRGCPRSGRANGSDQRHRLQGGVRRPAHRLRPFDPGDPRRPGPRGGNSRAVLRRYPCGGAGERGLIHDGDRGAPAHPSDFALADAGRTGGRTGDGAGVAPSDDPVQHPARGALPRTLDRPGVRPQARHLGRSADRYLPPHPRGAAEATDRLPHRDRGAAASRRLHHVDRPDRRRAGLPKRGAFQPLLPPRRRHDTRPLPAGGGRALHEWP